MVVSFRAMGGLTVVLLLAAACSARDPVPNALTAPPNLPPTGQVSADGAAPPRDPDAATQDASDAADAAVCLGETHDGGAPLGRCPASCKATCERNVPRYKGAVADALVTCLAARPTCSDGDVTLCLDRALAITCDTAEAQSACRGIVTRCDPNAGGVGSAISQEGCESIVRGMTAAGRAELFACIEAKIVAGTCPREVATCAEDIRR